MYNAKYILPGLIIFVGLFTLAFWGNIGTTPYSRPDIVLPANETECIEDVEYMRAEHMQILNAWRDMALREEKREYVAMKDGKVWAVSLQNTCMTCHDNYAEFCDKCHLSNSVTPYCWDCHVLPKGSEQ